MIFLAEKAGKTTCKHSFFKRDFYFSVILKDLIIRGGENIYPTEVEQFLYKYPKIQDVQVHVNSTYLLLNIQFIQLREFAGTLGISKFSAPTIAFLAF